MTNLVLLTVDSLRADYVFGPNAPDALETLPALIDEGVQYTNAFSNAAYTKGSFLSVLSGTYPWMFGGTAEGYGPDRPHIAEVLSEAGYATAGVQTNAYLGPVYEYDRGFDYYFGRDTTADSSTVEKTSSAYYDLIQRLAASSRVSDIAHTVYMAVGKRLGLQLGGDLYKPAGTLHDAAVEWLQAQSDPVFLWIHYMDVHTPYYPHESAGTDDISRRQATKLFYRVNDQREDAAAEDIATLESLYRGEIEYLDRQLGNFLERLDATVGLDDTVLAFTSDHGESFNEHGHVFHPGHALYDENVHIPLLLHGPDIGHGTVETPVSNADIVPTLLAQAGVTPPTAVVGDDITQFLTEAPERRAVFAEAWTPEDGHLMVTDGRFKLIRHLRTDEQELYDRHDTPSEAQNRAHEYPEVDERLSRLLDEHLEFVTQSHGDAERIDIPETVQHRLQKLGYDE
jgi:arylsulfatase A-like enzyme